MIKLGTILLSAFLATSAHAAGAGCEDTSGGGASGLVLEKVRATAVGTQIFGCINRSFESIVSSVPLLGATTPYFDKLLVNEIGAWTATEVTFSSDVVIGTGQDFTVTDGSAAIQAAIDSDYALNVDGPGRYEASLVISNESVFISTPILHFVQGFGGDTGILFQGNGSGGNRSMAYRFIQGTTSKVLMIDSNFNPDVDLENGWTVNGAWDSDGHFAFGNDDTTDLFSVHTTTFVIETTGESGFGTDSPDTLVHLSTVGVAATLRFEEADTLIESGDFLGLLEFEGQDASSNANGIRAKIGAITEGDTGETGISFHVADAGGGGAGADATAEAARFDSDSNLIMQTASILMATDSTGLFANTSDGSDNIQVGISGGGGLGNDRGGNIILKGNEDSSGGSIDINAGNVAGAFIRFTNPTEHMRITDGGEIAIGTTSVQGSAPTLMEIEGGGFQLSDTGLNQPILASSFGADTYYRIGEQTVGRGGYLQYGFTDGSFANTIPSGFSSFSGHASPTANVFDFRAGKTDGGTGTTSLAAGEVAYNFGNHNQSQDYLRIMGDGKVGVSSSAPEGLFTVGDGILMVDSGGQIGFGTNSLSHAFEFFNDNGAWRTVNITSETDEMALRVNVNAILSANRPGVHIFSNVAHDKDGSPLLEVNQNNASANQASLSVQNSGTGPAIKALDGGNTSFLLLGDATFVFGDLDDGDGFVHIHNGSAGSVTANANADELVVENSGNGGISILTPAGNIGRLIIASDDDNDAFQISWNDSGLLAQIGTEIASGELRFNTGAGAEILRLAGDNVGVNESSPATDVEITNADGPVLQLNDDGDSQTQIEADLTTTYFGNTSGTGDWQFINNNTGDAKPSAGAGDVKFTITDTIFSRATEATAPATCSIGDFYVDTSGAYCGCTATNTWSNFTGTGSCT